MADAWLTVIMEGLLKGKKYFIVDMDGTFYLDGTLIPGSDRFLAELQARGQDFYFFTNNSSHDEASCRERLAGMGYPVPEGKVMLSSQVALSFLRREYPDASVYLLGNERLRQNALTAGIRLTERNPDIVLLGFDTTLSYQKIWDAANYIADGALYFATHPDKNCPVRGGFMPDTGSMIALFAASTGKYPTVFGKPAQYTVDYITARLQCGREDLVFVGDRLETDIAIGCTHGVTTALVLTGVTTRESYAAQSEIQADIVAPCLADLIQYL